MNTKCRQCELLKKWSDRAEKAERKLSAVREWADKENIPECPLTKTSDAHSAYAWGFTRASAEVMRILEGESCLNK